jgi:hypothetical protein
VAAAGGSTPAPTPDDSEAHEPLSAAHSRLVFNAAGGASALGEDCNDVEADADGLAWLGSDRSLLDDGIAADALACG